MYLRHIFAGLTACSTLEKCRTRTAAELTWADKVPTIVAFTNEFSRLVIMKGCIEAHRTGMICFATQFYADEASLLEEYILTIDEHMGCNP